MKISVVTTLYYSAPYLEEFYQRLKRTLIDITDDYEIIFVNDGSPDDSLKISLKLQKQDKNIKIIDLSRNFGHHKAIRTGLTQSCGDYVFLIDSDLEEKPENLKLFWEKLIKEQSIDVVYGMQAQRKGGWFERLSGAIFYKIVNLMISDVSYPVNIVTSRLMTRAYVNGVLQFNESEYDLWCTFSLVGFNQSACFIKKENKGTTQYTFFKKIKLAVLTITSFSAMPLVLIFFIGILMFFLSSIGIIHLIIQKFIYNVPLGWTSIFVSIWFIGGLSMLSIGVIGIYLAKVFIETKKRPDTIIKNIYDEKNE
jgi:putative glycosyltransferase